MNLMKNFNKNYLFQNLKKSKVVLSIFIFIIPILNTVIELMILTANETELLSQAQISLLSLIGTYFLPIIISMCLFNYIYKRKSVDFINSMPISRKSIFITNTILGISIIILTLILNATLTLVVSLLLDRPILISMLLDYIWYVSLIYIYVFTTTNLAMTISGNAITQVILTMLLLFLVPYSTTFTKALYEQNAVDTYIKCTSEECRPKEYYCYEDEICLSNLKNNLYPLYLEKIENDNYTPPYSIIYNSLVGKESKIDITSSLKMLILTIIYILLGYKLFIQRKMEENETTFKNIHHHNIIKSLTLIPIASISYVILKESNIISSIFVVTIMLIYFLIYDLITKKSITNIRLTAIYFFITITIIVGTCYLIDTKTSNDLILDYKDIDSIAIKLNDDINSTNNKIIYIQNPELISLIIKARFDENENSSNGFTIYIKEKNNKEYKTYISINKKTYTKILNILNQEETYQTTYKSLNKKNIYALKLGNKLYNYNKSKKYIDIIEDTLNNLTLEEFIKLQNKYLHINDNYNITIYTYESHNRQEQTISGYINYELLNTIINDYNDDLSNNISTTIPKDYYIYYENSYLNNTYNIDYYVLKSAKNELYGFMLRNINEKVDMKDKYFSFRIEINNKEYIYTTNKVTEIQEILNAKYQEIKDTNEYKNYHNYNYETGVSYYD